MITQRAQEALSELQLISQQSYDGVISVGGDGMFAEIFNGVILKAAQDSKLDNKEGTREFVRPSIKVGLIPGGDYFLN